MLLTNCPPCPLFLEQGPELMCELGEPMEFGIFDFYNVFSRVFGEKDCRGDLECKLGGCRHMPLISIRYVWGSKVYACK